MSLIRKVLVVGFALCITAGPVFAAPMAVTAGSHVSAPSATVPGSFRSLLGTLAGSGIVFGIAVKKDIGAIATKFVQRAQAAAGDYKSGVQGAGGAWEQGAAGAEQAYEAGVQASIQNKRFAKGVQGKGSKYQTNAVNLGSQRYGPGVANAQQAYQAGMAPVISVLNGLQLPAKSFRGSPQNQARANAVSTALAAMRANK